MSRKPSLAEAMQPLDRRAASELEQVSASGSPIDPSPSERQRVPPSREGKKTVAGHFDPAVSRQLRQIALDENRTVQELLREALNDLFAKRSKPPIA